MLRHAATGAPNGSGGVRRRSVIVYGPWARLHPVRACYTCHRKARIHTCMTALQYGSMADCRHAAAPVIRMVSGYALSLTVLVGTLHCHTRTVRRSAGPIARALYNHVQGLFDILFHR